MKKSILLTILICLSLSAFAQEEDAEEMQEIAADLKDNMQKIEEHGERAISIIRGILLQSRGKEGEFLPTDIAALVYEYVWLSYHAMRAHNKDFNITIDSLYHKFVG